ncbi:MAG: nucleotidyltransferase domain-containing protein [Bacillota bacterium]
MKQVSVDDVVRDVLRQASGVFGTKLKKVVLFGSYARGDHTDESDMDIMLLLQMDDTDISHYRRKLAEIACEIQDRYDVVISLVGKNLDHFEYWSDTLPFYANVKNEGIYYDTAA